MRIRYRAVAASGALAAIGGAYLSIGFVGSFTENMTAGRGFIGLAVMICGRWMPQGALVFALLFGFFSALAQRLPGVLPVGGDAVPGAPVRDHADRGRRRRRPLDPAGRRRPPAGPIAGSRAPAGVRSSVAVRGLSWIVPLLAVGVTACGTSDSERFSLRTPGTDDPVVREIEGSEKPRRGKPTQDGGVGDPRLGRRAARRPRRRRRRRSSPSPRSSPTERTRARASPTASAIKEFNRGLPCGAKLVDTERGEGSFVVATFKLTERPGARHLRHGRRPPRDDRLPDRAADRIVQWLRGPDPAQPDNDESDAKSRRGDSNPWPATYKIAALPAELLRRGSGV